VKMHVAAAEALRKEGVETQFTTKIGGKSSLGPITSVIHGSRMDLQNFISSCPFRALL
jgi:hypothetical protein